MDIGDGWMRDLIGGGSELLLRKKRCQEAHAEGSKLTFFDSNTTQPAMDECHQSEDEGRRRRQRQFAHEMMMTAHIVLCHAVQAAAAAAAIHSARMRRLSPFRRRSFSLPLGTTTSSTLFSIPFILLVPLPAHIDFVPYFPFISSAF